MLTFLSVTDLRNRLQNASFDDVFGQSVINDGIALVRGLAHQTLDFVQGDTQELQGGKAILTLPERPVVVDIDNPLSVAELDVRGHPWPSIEGQFWYRRGDQLIRQWPTQWVPQMQVPWVHETSRLWAPIRPPGVWAQRVLVTWSHGFTSDAQLAQKFPSLKLIMLDVAVQYATNPMMLRSEQVGQITLTYGLESMRSPEDIDDEVKKRLRSIGLRRGGAFSIASI